VYLQLAFPGDQRLYAATAIAVRGHIGGQGVEGSDIGQFEVDVSTSGVAYHQQGVAILDYGIARNLFAPLVGVG
jgi:hypothetical protein